MTGTAFFTLLAQTKSLGPLFLMTGTAVFTLSTFSSSPVIFRSSRGCPGSARGAQIDPRGSPWLRRGAQTDPPGVPRDARGTKTDPPGDPGDTKGAPSDPLECLGGALGMPRDSNLMLWGAPGSTFTAKALKGVGNKAQSTSKTNERKTHKGFNLHFA